MFENGPFPVSSGNHIVVGSPGNGPDWRAKFLWFWSGKKKMLVLAGGPVLLAIVIGLVVFLLWPSSKPTQDTATPVVGQSQDQSSGEEQAKAGDTPAKTDDTKPPANGSTPTGGGSTGGSGGSSGGGTSSGGGGGSSGGSTPVSCPNSTHTPGGPDSFGGCWPYAGNTGIPAGTVLSAYTSSCTVTANNFVINAKTVNCNPLEIRASNVQITNSKINGTVYIDQPNIGYSFTITDSEVDAGGPTNSGIGKSNFVATRVHVHGGYRSIWCEYSCTVQDSWLHGQASDPSGVAHESAVRMGDGSTIRHNSILCDAPDFPPDAGCSADLTGYGDFAPIRNNTIYRNLFVATTGGVCAYGGSSGDDGTKPYGDQAANIVFQDNIFQHGSGGKCGYYFPITDFDDSRPGNQWLNNKWDDGTVLPPAN